MGFGIIGLLKQIAPFLVYLLFIGLSILAIAGRPRWALLLTTALLPLRNVADKLDQYPLGKDVIDILMICMILGWVFSSLTQRHRFFERSPFNGVIVALVLYSYLSFLNGYSYLDYFTPFDFSDSRLQYLKNFCLLPILYFITLNTIKDKKWIRRVIMVICATMILMNYYMVSQLSWFASVASRAKMHGTFVFLGPNEVAAFALIFGRKKLTGSLIGGIKETQQMLDFCARKKVFSEIELISASEINQAYERVLKSQVRYRFVIDARTF